MLSMLDLKALLSKILNLLKGDNGDWTSISSDYLECSKRSGIVTIMGFSSGQVYLTAGQWNNIATLPSGYRPKKNFSFVAFNRSQIQPLVGQVTSGGIVRLYCDTGQYGSYWMFNASFPVVGGVI